MIKCPSCGYDNVPGTQFCEGCGEEIGATAATAAVSSGPSAAPTDSSPDAGQIKCPACDNLNPSDNVVCEVCGTELRDVALDATVAPPSAPDQTVGAMNAAAPPTAPATTPFDAPLSAPPTPPDNSAAAGIDSDAPAATFDTPIATSPDTAAIATSTDATLPDVPVSTAAPVNAAPDVPVVAPGADAAMAAPATTPSTGGDLQPGRVKLTVEQGMTVGKQFVLGDNEVLVGREDDEDGIYPDIDLSDQDEGYVHRRHATLNFNNGTLTVTHLGGANKSRLNNKPLPDNEPQPVNIGDKIAFGKVVLRVGAN